jgi:hypothetical protein
MATIDTSQSLTVPKFLYGPSRSGAHRRWKAFAKRAIKVDSWKVALGGVELMTIEEVKGDFSAGNSRAIMFEGENLWLDECFEDFLMAIPRGLSSDADAERICQLTSTGLDHFCFALIFSVAGAGMGMWRSPANKRKTACLCLPKMLRWWPIIRTFDQRFSQGQKACKMSGGLPMFRGWPSWGAGLGNLLNDLGMTWEESTCLAEAGPDMAADIAAEWLRKHCI